MTEPSSGKVVVRKDTTVTLECKANGNPSPTVTWTKRGLAAASASHVNRHDDEDGKSERPHQHSGRGGRAKKIHKPGENLTKMWFVGQRVLYVLFLLFNFFGAGMPSFLILNHTNN
jgi:hypothetical protein